MKVIRAKTLGCCFGVRKAIDAVEQALKSKEKMQNTDVYTFGPLIHNAHVLNDLKNRGVKILEEKDLEHDITSDSIVVIRAHGIPPQIMKKLAEKNVQIVDATCPHVLASQKKAYQLAQQGRTIILAGDKNHGEIAGIAGHVQNSFCGDKDLACFVVQNAFEAERLPFFPQKAALLSQTTFLTEEFSAITAALQKKIDDLIICNTICSATHERQAALLNLAGAVSAVLVIGGKDSANTKRLFNTAKQICSQVALIEDAQEIPQSFFSASCIGITAGASTPDAIIDKIEHALQEL